MADRWILSKANALAKEVTDNMDRYELGIALPITSRGSMPFPRDLLILRPWESRTRPWISTVWNGIFPGLVYLQAAVVGPQDPGLLLRPLRGTGGWSPKAGG